MHNTNVNIPIILREKSSVPTKVWRTGQSALHPLILLWIKYIFIHSINL